MIIDDIALTLQPEVGPKTASYLIEIFGSAQDLFAAPEEEIRQKAQLKPKIAAELAAKKYHKQAQREIEFIQKYNVSTLVSTQQNYPELLRECYDYPHVLYMIGDPALLQQKMIAFAGTRSITSYGLTVSEMLISGMAEALSDVVIVGGLSYGIDVACHRAAIAAGIPSIVVLPHALNTIYPAHHVEIAREIVRNGGALLTECHSEFVPTASVLLRRNRIVAGLCAGTVIVESPEEGGSLTTAQFALDYDRCLMAVPGRVTDRTSGGTNALIKALKARAVCSTKDILREMNWEPEVKTDGEVKKEMTEGSEPFGAPAGKTRQAIAKLGKNEQGLLGCFHDQDVLSDEELVELSGLSPSELAVLLLNLEIAGAVRALPGNRFEVVLRHEAIVSGS